MDRYILQVGVSSSFPFFVFLVLKENIFFYFVAKGNYDFCL